MAKQSRYLLSVLLMCLLLSGCAARLEMARLPLPHVTAEMEDPSFWIDKLEYPDSLLLTSQEIMLLNEEIRSQVEVTNVLALPEMLPGESVRAMMTVDLESHRKLVRYGHNNHPLTASFYEGILRSMDMETIPSQIELQLGLVTRQANLRAVPTDEIAMEKRSDYEFDYFQHSALELGEPLAICHFSKDRSWAFVQCSLTHGWVRSADFGMATDRSEIERHCRPSQRLVVTGNEIDIYSDSTCVHHVGSLTMGATIPLRDKGRYGYTVDIPSREVDGDLSMERGFVAASENVSEHYLPSTQANLLRQAFRCLGQPYGWGGMFGATDCSQYVMDVFASFGIRLPRNSRSQLQVGRTVANFSRETSEKAKTDVLSKAMPGATLVGWPGHVMIYIGQHAGRHYVTHNTWAYRERRWFVDDVKTIGQVAVSDLTLGDDSKRGSLLKRLMEIRTIGVNP